MTEQNFYDLICSLFDYDAENGLLIRKRTQSNRVKLGEVAGSTDRHGYLLVSINGKHYRIHRLIWFLHYGKMPELHIDHINGIKNDNRISNLRLATRSQNLQNRGKNSNNKSGYKGVSPHSCGNRWSATITTNGKFEYLGIFKTAEEAAEAYKKRSQAMHGEFHKL